MQLDSTAWIIAICSPLLQVVVATFNCTSPTPQSLFDALEKELVWRKSHPPVQNFSQAMVISLDVTVVGILGVKEKEQSLIIYLWQVLEWDIEGLSWDEKECGTNRVSILREKLWYPDIHISEFMDEDKSPITPYVYLYNTGHVYDDRPLRVVSTCKLGIYTFPFDLQNCSLTFGSYLHFAKDIRMVPSTTPEEVLGESLDVAQTDGEWELINIEIVPITLQIAVGNYSQIRFNTILRRRPILYIVNLLIPSCFLVTLDLFSFLLPPQSVDRSAFEMTLILGYTVFLLLMNDLLPDTGHETPLLNVFFCLSLALMVANLLETVFITNLYFHSSHYGAVPRWLRILVLQYLAVFVGLRPMQANRVTVSLPDQAQAVTVSVISSRELHRVFGDLPPEKPADHALEELRKLSRDLQAIRLLMDYEVKGSKVSQEWKMIATIVDRLLFGLYVIFLTVSLTTILVLAYLSRFI